MKKVIWLLAFAFFILLSTFSASAETYDRLLESSGGSNLLTALPEEVQDSLYSLGVDSVDYTKLNEITFSDVISLFTDMTVENAKSPLTVLSTLIAVMLLYSVFFSLKTSAKTTSMENVLSICITLCITCLIVAPVTQLITTCSEVITTASNFMLAYIPVMLVIMVSGGHAVSGATYYSFMIFAGQGVGQVSSKIITPLLNIFLGLTVTSALSPQTNLNGLLEYIGKVTKWLLGFVMTMFTAFLTFKQLITTPLDNMSTRAVRFTLTSLVPVVGSALSDAYKTVQSSVSLLKSGVGVFVIISVAIIFMPVIIKCLFWSFTLNLAKAVAEILNLKEPVLILKGINIVITTVFAVLLCIMSIYIILTALVLLLGGGGS